LSLLREIQDLATSDSDIANLLRKCSILAARLGSDEFAQWIGWELNGYPEHQSLPDYRSLDVSTFATFMNAAWRAEKQPILWEALPPQAKEALECIQFRDGIAKVRNLGKGAIIPRPDVAVRVDGKMFPDMHCVQAWQQISSGEFEQLLSAIRNRILEFVLKIEAENPDAGEAELGSKPVPQDKLQPLVNNFFGNVGNLAQRSHSFSQVSNAGINSKELSRLVEELSKHMGELNLGERQALRAEAQIAALRAELKGEPDSEAVRQAGRTLRNITEGAIGSLLASGAQPTVWHWIHQTLTSIGW
jgi:hypothetical protein